MDAGLQLRAAKGKRQPPERWQTRDRMYTMKERRQHQRTAINGWASLQHPLLGTITAEVEDISAGGMSLRLDDDRNFFVMMELDAKIHAGAVNDSLPPVTVQVVRVQRQRVGLRFQEIGAMRHHLRPRKNAASVRSAPSESEAYHCLLA